MSSKQKLYIAGMGMITPVGGDVELTAAAIRAGISQLSISNYYNKKARPFTMATIPESVLPERSYKLNRVKDISRQTDIMLKASTIALGQAMTRYPGEKTIPLFFSGPEAYQNVPYTVSPDFTEYLIKQTDAKIDRANSRFFSLGRAGVIDAIDLATRYFEQIDESYVLVGGADSFQDEAVLAYLDADDRVLSEGVMDGFAPGEASAFLLLTKDISKALIHNNGVISLSEPGIALEKGHRYNEAENYLGEGLSQAFKLALNAYNGKPIKKIYSSMNGEHFGAKEYGVASIRSQKAFTEDCYLHHPADCMGDAGGAVGAVLIALAADDLLKEGEEKTSLVYCSSDQAYRAAICVNFELLS